MGKKSLIYRIAEALHRGEAQLPEDIEDEIRDLTDPSRILDDGRIVLRLLPAPYTDTVKDEPPEGVKVEKHDEVDEEDGFEWTWAEWTIPTLGEPFYVRDSRIWPRKDKPPSWVKKNPKELREWEDRNAERLVLSFGGRSWRVHLNDVFVDEALPLKGSSFLVFTQTDEPPTMESEYPDPKPGYRHSGVQIFGQPHFVQNEHYPSHKGKPAYLLWNRETGRGDINIENVFIALDEDGLPCKAWSEESGH